MMIDPNLAPYLDLKQPTCPMCGAWPAMLTPTVVAAVCSNRECEVVSWDLHTPAAVQLAAEPQVMPSLDL